MHSTSTRSRSSDRQPLVRVEARVVQQRRRAAQPRRDEDVAGRLRPAAGGRAPRRARPARAPSQCSACSALAGEVALGVQDGLRLARRAGGEGDQARVLGRRARPARRRRRAAASSSPGTSSDVAPSGRAPRRARRVALVGHDERGPRDVEAQPQVLRRAAARCTGSTTAPMPEAGDHRQHPLRAGCRRASCTTSPRPTPRAASAPASRAPRVGDLAEASTRAARRRGRARRARGAPGGAASTTSRAKFIGAQSLVGGGDGVPAPSATPRRRVPCAVTASAAATRRTAARRRPCSASLAPRSRPARPPSVDAARSRWRCCVIVGAPTTPRGRDRPSAAEGPARRALDGGASRSRRAQPLPVAIGQRAGDGRRRRRACPAAACSCRWSRAAAVPPARDAAAARDAAPGPRPRRRLRGERDGARSAATRRPATATPATAAGPRRSGTPAPASAAPRGHGNPKPRPPTAATPPKPAPPGQATRLRRPRHDPARRSAKRRRRRRPAAPQPERRRSPRSRPSRPPTPGACRAEAKTQRRPAGAGARRRHRRRRARRAARPPPCAPAGNGNGRPRAAASIAAGEPAHPPTTARVGSPHGRRHPFSEKTDEQKAITEMVRQFVDEQILPQRRALRPRGRVPRADRRADEGARALRGHDPRGVRRDGARPDDLRDDRRGALARLDLDLRRRQHALHRLLPADEVRHRRAEGEATCRDGHRRDPRRLLALRARARLRRPGDQDDAPRSSTTATTRSTARRCGSPTACAPASSSCSSRPTPTADPPLQGHDLLHRREGAGRVENTATRASPSRRRSRRWATRASSPPSSSSTATAARPRTSSAARRRASARASRR